MERRNRRRQIRERQRRAAERQKRIKIEQERRRRQKEVRKKWAALGATAVLLILFLWGGASIRAEKKAAEEQRQEQADQAAKAAAKAQKKEEQKKEEQQAEEEMGETMVSLENTVEDLIDGYEGNWSVYVEELKYENSFSIHNQGMYPASLVKIYVMAATFENMEQVIKNETDYLGSEEGAKDTVAELLENMIEISDNESYNELVRLQSSNRNFGEGCGFINAYLQEEGYTGSGVHTTLHPAVSSTANDGLGDNVTCVEDSENFWKRFTKETAVPRKIPEKCSIFF